MDNKDNDFDIKEYEKYIEIPESDPEPEQKTKPEPVRYEDVSSSSPKKRSEKSPLIVVIFVLLAAMIVAGVFLVKAFKEKIRDLKENTTSAVVTTLGTVRVTFPEGFTVYQMGQRLEESGVCSAEDFYQAANTPVEGIEPDDRGERVFLLEGYLFPDTYDFYKNESPQSVIGKFISNYQSKVTPEIQAEAQSLGYTMDEMLTLASIIQKECDKEVDECRNVSSVFHNRLSNSKESYLGSDVTYFYLKNMADYLGGADSEHFDALLLEYYTYRNYRKGLPAGPICNPGIKAIKAAVEPNDTKYQFFLTDQHGEKFFFAETYEQHLKNAKEAGLK